MAPMEVVFSEDVAFARHVVATCSPPPSHPIGVLVVLAMPVKSYLKCQENQLAIQCTVDTILNNYRFVEKHCRQL